jgi:3-methyladenine DNA glycosylase AlkD
VTTAIASPTTARATAFVADRRRTAQELGAALADLTGDPAAFCAGLRDALLTLTDPGYAGAQQVIAPGIGPVIGVRWPLMEALKRGFRTATRRDRTSTWLFVADRLLREDEMEPRWFAFGLLERLILDEPERAWQLVRRAAREAGDWITVDSLAHVVGRGVLAEPYRWAELEQLVYSPSPWERRLVGSAIATIPFVDRRRGREPLVAEHGLGLVGQLIGDDAPEVQKALAWALRSLVLVDAKAVAAFCTRQADVAVATDDGFRAWVVRDALAKLDASIADGLRARLAGIRRRAGASPTSEAATAAARFGAGLLSRPMPEPPLT